MTTLIIIMMVLPIITIGIYVVIYNGLQSAKTRIDQGWSGIEVQLKRRHDLIPTLISTVKSAMKHETEIFTQLSNAREQAMAAVNNGSKAQIAETELALSQALSGFQIRMEDNPEITATSNIEVFQKQLEETEDQISAARRLYNGNVQVLNQRIVTFPGNLVAAQHSIVQAAPFKLEKHERAKAYTAPTVDLDS